MDNNFEGTKKSSERIAEGITKFMEKLANLRENESGFRIRQAAREYIRNFPVPSNKEDLIDFILYLDERRKDRKFGDEFFHKWKESNKKAMLLFPDDPTIISLTKESSTKKWSNLSSTQQIILICIILVLVGLIGSLFG